MNILTLLKISGYVNISKRETFHDREVVINNNHIIDRTNSININNNCFKKYINYSYIFLCFICTLIIPVYSIVKSINNNDIYIFTTNLINWIFLIQFICGLILIKKNKVDIQLIKNSSNIYFSKIFIIIPIIFVLVYCILLVKNYYITFYSDIYNESSTGIKILLIITLIYEKFINYIIIFTNILIFICIFNSVKNNIKDFLASFISIIDNREKIDISTIISEFSQIKSTHKKYVESTNSMFGLLVICSLLSGYFIALRNTHQELSITQYINVIICVLLIISYFLIINKVKNNVQEIKSLINSEKFQLLYRDNSDITIQETNIDMPNQLTNLRDVVISMTGININNNLNTNENDNILLKTALTTSFNKSLSEWIIIDRKLSGNWENFQIVGFEIEDTTLLQKAVFIITSFFMLSSLV